MKKIILILLVSLMIISFVSASEFSEYEINKLEELLYEDCKYSIFLFVCEELDNFGLQENEPCIDFEVEGGFSIKKILQEWINYGKLIKNEKEDREYYLLRIENISKEKIREYLELNNQGVFGSIYLGTNEIACNIDESENNFRYFYRDKYNQKYWGDKLIKEPRTIINIENVTIFGFSFLGGIGVTLICIKFYNKIRKKRKKIKLNTQKPNH